MRRRSITHRTQDRVHRLAYEFQDLAARASQDGLPGLAWSFREIACRCGDLARNDDQWRHDE
jgi:hypothetical protein